MPLFMIQASYTPEAWAAMVKNPQDRKEALEPLVQRCGGTLIELYYCFGDNDIMFIFEAPDASAAAAVSIAGNVAGHIKAIKTTQLLSAADSLELLRRTRDLGPAPAPSAG